MLAKVEGKCHEHLNGRPVGHLPVLDEVYRQQDGVSCADLGQQFHEEIPHGLLLVAGAHHDGAVELVQRGVVHPHQYLEHLDVDGGLLVQPVGVGHHVGLAELLRHPVQERHHLGAGLLGGGLAEGLPRGVQVRQAGRPRRPAALDGLRHGTDPLQGQRLAGLHVLHLGVGLEGLQQQDAGGLDVHQVAPPAEPGRPQRVHRLAVRRERRLQHLRLRAGGAQGRHVAPVLLRPRHAPLVVRELAHRLVALVGPVVRDDVLDLALAVHRVLGDLRHGLRHVPHGGQVELQHAGDGALHVVRPQRLVVQQLHAGHPAVGVARPERAQQGALAHVDGVGDGREGAHLAVPQRGGQVGHLDEGAVMRAALHAQRGGDQPVAEHVAGQLGARGDLGVPVERGLDAILEQRLGRRQLG